MTMTKLSTQLETWLKEFGYSPAAVPDENASWHVVVTHPKESPNKMHVFTPTAADDAVVLLIAATISPEHIAGFDRLDGQDRLAFLFELKRALNQLPVGYRLGMADGRPPGRDECPQHFLVTATRFADGLSKDALATTLGDVYKTWLGAVLVVQERLGGGDVGPAGRFDFKKIGLP